MRCIPVSRVKKLDHGIASHDCPVDAVTAQVDVVKCIEYDVLGVQIQSTGPERWRLGEDVAVRLSAMDRQA